MSRKFICETWAYDGSTNAVIADVEKCSKEDAIKEAELELFLQEDEELEVLEGVCKYQCRTDWENGDGSPQGGYSAYICKHSKRPKGYFNVWICQSTKKENNQ